MKEVVAEESITNSNLWLGIFIGSLIGAGTALLLSPVTGRQAREYVEENLYKPAVSTLSGLMGRVPVKVREVAEVAKKKVSKLEETVNSTVKSPLQAQYNLGMEETSQKRVP